MSKDEILEGQRLKTIAHGAGLTFIGSVVGYGLKYILSIVLARFLGAQMVGLYFLGQTITNLAATISRAGLDNGVLKFIPSYQVHGQEEKVKVVVVETLGFTFGVSILISTIIFVTKSWVARFFEVPGLVKIIPFFAIALPFVNLMTVAAALAKAFKRIDYSVIPVNIVQPLLNLLAISLFFLLGFRIFGALVAYILSLVLTSFLSLFYIRRLSPGKYTRKGFLQIGSLVIYSLPLLLVSFLNFITMWIDTLMLGFFKGAFEVGIYNAAVKTATLSSFILVSFNAIFAPTISELYSKGDMKELGRLFQTVTRWIVVFTWPMFLFILLFSKDIMLLFGKEFGIGSTALTLLALGQLVNSAVGSVGYLLVMTGWQKLMMINTLGICFLNILLNYFLVPRYSIDGAAAATGFSNALFNIVMLIEVAIILRVQPYNVKFLKPLLSGVVASLIVLLLNSIVPAFDSVIVFQAIFFIAIYMRIMLAMRLENEDKVIIESVLRKLIIRGGSIG
ncbi:flippase [Calderihabitans maritimus]|uniref:Membrane protein involved in the export of O-antigen and teichoic acid n=1 Tax=Calderihabitans maritimus TaxID=1246530 RepID=A0A1Z5HXJ9_9FIRM|nr:flippase [Calderihabitans maritimus]GAW94061.1 membrane protein involved in the export of O-antigen and teichoic acid [Calderihabitans maritimus]